MLRRANERPGSQFGVAAALVLFKNQNLGPGIVRRDGGAGPGAAISDNHHIGFFIPMVGHT